MTTEIDVLDPIHEPVKLESGKMVIIEDLRSRQFFRLLRIVTRGALPLLADTNDFRLSTDMPKEEFGAKLLSIVAMAIPEAEDETIDFLRSMVSPHGLIKKRDRNKQEEEHNRKLWADLDAEMINPSLEDLITLVEVIIKRESEDIQALGKRLMGMFKVAQKTGQVPESLNQIFQGQNSSEDSAEPSTLSSPNTDGPTTNVETYQSVGSDNNSPL